MILFDWFHRVSEWVEQFAEEHRIEVLYALFGLLVAVVRAAGRTVVSGTTGLKFSFGRAGRLCPPGFYPLIPFLQVVRVMPTRSRTINLSTQQVTTLDGLVYTVDANLVYRVVDVRRALIEIDELERGMLQMLGLAVQAVLRKQDRASLRVSGGLDGELAAKLAESLEPWGVAVESAGLTTITPTRETLRLTQLSVLGMQRLASLETLQRGGMSRSLATALLGPRQRLIGRGRALRERERERARQRRRIALLGAERAGLLEELAAQARARQSRSAERTQKKKKAAAKARPAERKATAKKKAPRKTATGKPAPPKATPRKPRKAGAQR